VIIGLLVGMTTRGKGSSLWIATAFLLALLPSRANATLWTVLSGGSPITPNNLPYYSPQLLTIEVGDQVRWSNQGGIHNVNGSQVTFPGNPQGFYNGLPDGGLWTWTFTYTMPGVYNYHCDGDGHAATQFGTITVLDPMGVAAVSDADFGFRLFPSPAEDWLEVEMPDDKARSFAVVTLDGATVLNSSVDHQRSFIVDVRGLKPANYFLLITDRNGRVSAKPFTRQ